MRTVAAQSGSGIRARLAARPALVAALVYAVLALAMVSPALPPGRSLSASDALWLSPPWTAQRGHVHGLGANIQMADSYRLFQPTLLHTRSELPHIPLWDPYLMGGRPYLGNGQSSIFSPFSAPAYVLPFWRSLALIAALKLFVAAFGTFLLARALRMRFAPALMSGLLFAFSLWFVSWLAWTTTSVWAFLPWLWLAADAIARRADPLAVCGLAAVVGLQFLCGHPESNFQVMVLTAVFFVLRLVSLRRDGRHPPALRAQLAAFAGATALGVALAALALVPLLELLAHSADSSTRTGFSHLHSPPKYLLGLFLPHYWGRPTGAQTDPIATPFLHTRAYYVGVLPLMLAAAALLARRDLERVALAAIAVISVLIVVGLPPLPGLLGLLPGFDVANNARFVIAFVLCLALLAGWGLEELLARPVRLSATRLLAICAVLIAIPLIWVLIAGERPWVSTLGRGFLIAWSLASPHSLGLAASPAEVQRSMSEIHAGALFGWLVFAGLALLLLGLRLAGRVRPATFAALALALVALDLFHAGMGINPSIRVADATQPVTPALRYLQARAPSRAVGLGSALPVDVALRYRIQDVRGYDFPIEQRYRRLWERLFAKPGCNYYFCSSSVSLTPSSLRGMRLLGVSSLIDAPSGPPLHEPGLRLAYQGPDARIYANERALPRAFVVEGQQVASSSEAALDAVSAAGFDPRLAAITEARVDGVPTSGAGSSPATPASITSYDEERVKVDAVARRPGILVLSDSFFPGWKATVDGKATPIERVDYLFRGVRLEPGRHRVEFRYEPVSWRLGWVVTLTALVLLAVVAVVGFRRRPTRASPRAS